MDVITKYQDLQGIEPCELAYALKNKLVSENTAISFSLRTLKGYHISEERLYPEIKAKLKDARRIEITWSLFHHIRHFSASRHKQNIFDYHSSLPYGVEPDRVYEATGIGNCCGTVCIRYKKIGKTDFFDWGVSNHDNVLWEEINKDLFSCIVKQGVILSDR